MSLPPNDRRYEIHIVKIMTFLYLWLFFLVDIIQFKYTIEGVSKILVPPKPDLFPESEPREIGLVKGNQNLANFRNGINSTVLSYRNKH